MMQIYLSLIIGILCLGLISIFLSSGCAISTPFKRHSDMAQIQDEELIWVGLTCAVLGSNKNKNKVFWSNTDAVLDSLRRGDHPGFLGHSVRKEILGNTSWTMTVWKDEASLDAFVRSPVHTKAMREARAVLVHANFTRVKRRAKDIPLSWDAAEKILAKQSNNDDMRNDNSRHSE